MSAGTARRRTLQTGVVAGLALLLAGCGFHLRGQVRLPTQMERTYISGLAPTDALARRLRESLRANGVQVVRKAQEASAVLRIKAFKTSRSVLSVGADGQVSAYRLVSSLEYSVHATQGRWHIPPQHLQVQRQYSYSTSQTLGKNDEAAQLRADMSRQLVNLLMLRLQANARGKP